MSLDEKFAGVQTIVSNMVGSFFQKIAGLFGYPNNPGMPVRPDIENEIFNKLRFLNSLPRRTTSWSSQPTVEGWFEVIFGGVPKLETVPKYIYESKEEGFYNFYIENYQNLYFLPDSLSQFLQVDLNICLDTTILESIREVLFVGLIVYSQIITLRLILYWFIILNPYVVPWCYLSALVDWTEEILQGILPSVFGINLAGSLFLGMLGIVVDSLNHLVFTMPFLPSEGEESQLLIDQDLKDVLIFHYLPVLWYRYPIPNEIRKFWYEKRPDILDYMIKSYQNLEINFFPNLETSLPDYSSTELLSNTSFLDLNHCWMDFNSFHSIIF